MQDVKPEAPLSAQQVHEALYDGADLPVKFIDGAAAVIKVRKIPRGEFAQYAMIMGSTTNDEAAECGFYAGRDAAWAFTLADESFDQVLEEGQRLNFPRFTNWFSRQARKLQLVKDQTALIAQAGALLADNPSLRTLLGSTNGSSRRDIPTPISGDTRRTSSG